MRITLAAPLGALLFVVSAPSQEEEGGGVAASPQAFVLEVGNHELQDMVGHAAAYLDYNILLNEHEMQGSASIRITHRTEVDRKGCWELLGSLLYHKGFAIIPLDRSKGLYEVISMQGPRSREVMGGAQFVPAGEVEAYANLKAIPIMTSVSLQHTNATVANNALRPFFASAGGVSGLTLGNVGNNRDMLLVGFGPQVAAACRLLKLVDTGDDGGKSQVRVVRLQHAMADELVASIEDTLGMRGMHAGMQGGMPPSSAVRAVAHRALNAVILRGTDLQIRDAQDLIVKLDAPAVEPSRVSEDMGKRMKQLEARIQKLEKALRAAK